MPNAAEPRTPKTRYIRKQLSDPERSKMAASVDETASEPSSCFDEILIKEVEKWPTLYNSALREHRDKQKRSLLWKSIGRTLQKPPGDCEHRWRYLRDKYVKEKKKLTDPVFANEKKEPWPYMASAQFLDPFLKPKMKAPRKPVPRAVSSRPTRLRRAAQQTPLQTLAVLCSLPSPPVLDSSGAAADFAGSAGVLGSAAAYPQPPQRKKTILGDNSKTLQALNRAAKRTASREEHFLLSLVNKFAALPDDFKDEFEMSTLCLLAKLKKKAAALSKAGT